MRGAAKLVHGNLFLGAVVKEGAPEEFKGAANAHGAKELMGGNLLPVPWKGTGKIGLVELMVLGDVGGVRAQAMYNTHQVFCPGTDGKQSLSGLFIAVHDRLKMFRPPAQADGDIIWNRLAYQY